MARATGEQADQAGWTGHTYQPESWAEFDSLPRGMKRVYWEAAYCYTALPAVEAMWAGLDLRRAAAALRARQALDVQREVRRLYGRRHPQAGVAA